MRCVRRVKIQPYHVQQVDDFLIGLNDEHGIDLGTASGKLAAYGVCTYFVTTVFSTVGFGDISATNSTERVV